MTNVDRVSRCIVGWDVLWERDEEHLQALLDRSPQARLYYSDQFPTYDTLIYYPGKHYSLPNKRQTYSVEADNAELRHYLARLVRKSRCIHALWRSVKLFVIAWNRRQLPCTCQRFCIPLTFATPAFEKAFSDRGLGSWGRTANVVCGCGDLGTSRQAPSQ